MEIADAIIASFADHNAAETAVKKLTAAGDWTAISLPTDAGSLAGRWMR